MSKRAWLWLLLAIAYSAPAIILPVVLYLELIEPGQQYLPNSDVLIHIGSIYGIFSFLILPQMVFLSILKLWQARRFRRAFRTRMDQISYVLLALGLIALLLSLFLPMSWLFTFGAIASGLVLVWLTLVTEYIANDKRPRLWLAWVSLCLSVFGLVIAIVTALVLVVTSTMVRDRIAYASFFDPSSGNSWWTDPLLAQHVLWFFGHPEIMIVYPFMIGIAVLAGTVMWALALLSRRFITH